MVDQIAVVYFEDDPPSRFVMEMMLIEELQLPHVTVIEESTDFTQVVEALDPLPTVFLLDIHIRPYNGFEMLEILRQHPIFQNAIVVALTASVMSDEVQRLKEAGFDGVIPKPINPVTFPNTFERLLNGEKVWRVS